MEDFKEFATSFWMILNYRLVKLGESSITLSAILLNLFLIMLFLLISSKIKSWLLKSIEVRKGVNVGNWRARYRSKTAAKYESHFGPDTEGKP